VMYRAIENWNNRPLEDALAAERDALKERVEEYGYDIAKWLREADKWHEERRRLEYERDELRVSDENLRRIIGDAESILNDDETSDDDKWDALKPLLAKAYDGHGWDTASEMAAERDAALARVERLEAALQPLAALWRDGMERDPDSKTLWDHPDITVGDIRRARRELGEE